MDNRGKRSIVLDLTTDDGTRDRARIAQRRRRFPHQHPPRRVAAHGPGLRDGGRRAIPRLVYGLITGYGERDPTPTAPPTTSPRSGPGGPGAPADPPRRHAAVSAGRHGRPHGGHDAGRGGVCGTGRADATGTGQLVSTSLYRQGAYTVSFDLNTFLMTGHSIAIGQRETMGNPCMNNYTAGDGRRFWIVGLQGERHWPALCRAVGRPDWLTDPRFDTARSRAANAVELIARARRDLRDQAARRMGESLCRRTGLLLVADQLDRGRGGRRAVPRRRRRRLRARRRLPACRWSRRPPTSTARRGSPASAAPQLGEHTEEILAELKNLRVMLDARRVPKLGEEVVVIVAAHQVMRNRHADGGRHRQSCDRARREPLESVPHQRNDP